MRKLMIDGCIKGFISFCYTITTIKDFFTNLYQNYEGFKFLCDSVYYPLEYAYYTITFQRLEPKAKYWCSHCWITYNDTALTSRYNLSENIQIMDEPTGISIWIFFYDVFMYYHSLCTVMDSTTHNNKLDPLFVIKNISDDNQPYYTVYQMYLPPEDYGYTPSHASFLSITYNHPDMKHAIELKLNKSWLMTGNQLFTPTFILRALEYQSESYVFDDYYKIKVIDSNVNMFEFGINKYMVLTEDFYIIATATSSDNKGIGEDGEDGEDEDLLQYESESSNVSSDSIEIEGTIVE